MVAINTSKLQKPRKPLLAALLACGLLAVAAGCGDDEGEQTNRYSSGDDVVSTTAEPGGASTIPDLPVNEDPAAVQCTAPPEEVFDATATVGTPIGSARRAAKDAGCSIRVAVLDGEPRALTQDFRPDRVNVAVADGEVTEIINIG